MADNSAEERNEKENKARGKMDSRGKKGIFRVRGKGEKKKRYFAVLMGESRSLGLVQIMVTVTFFKMYLFVFPLIKNEKNTDWNDGKMRRTNLCVNGKYIFFFFNGRTRKRKFRKQWQTWEERKCNRKDRRNKNLK